MTEPKYRERKMWRKVDSEDGAMTFMEFVGYADRAAPELPDVRRWIRAEMKWKSYEDCVSAFGRIIEVYEQRQAELEKQLAEAKERERLAVAQVAERDGHVANVEREYAYMKGVWDRAFKELDEQKRALGIVYKEPEPQGVTLAEFEKQWRAADPVGYDPNTRDLTPESGAQSG